MLEDRILSCLSHVLKCEITPEDYQRNPVEELEMDSFLPYLIIWTVWES